jgi:hypothetical protein
LSASRRQRWREIVVKTYQFDVVLKGLDEVTDEQADALFEAGCDDGTPTARNSIAWSHFDREAPSLEAAINSAVSQVRSAGLSVSKIEMDADSELIRES